MKISRNSLTLAVLLGGALLPSCSVFVAGAKAMSDGISYVVQGGNYIHSEDAYGRDMFDHDTLEKVAGEFDARETAFKRDMSSVHHDTNRLFFNYDKDNPYNH
ncbi:MAG: hypothetical protein OTJ44_02670 [Planctomycetota bacterium]|jgi:hypothetical protein|nr:hypothetical protein [Planctomycetota bacterium]